MFSLLLCSSRSPLPLAPFVFFPTHASLQWRSRRTASNTQRMKASKRPLWRWSCLAPPSQLLSNSPLHSPEVSVSLPKPPSSYVLFRSFLHFFYSPQPFYPHTRSLTHPTIYTRQQVSPMFGSFFLYGELGMNECAQRNRHLQRTFEAAKRAKATAPAS